jgi:hypothetical protein
MGSQENMPHVSGFVFGRIKLKLKAFGDYSPFGQVIYDEGYTAGMARKESKVCALFKPGYTPGEGISSFSYV